MRTPDMARAARLGRHGDVSTALALCSDRELGELVEAGSPVGAGIGGRAVLMEVGGAPLFVKRVPLTDLERLPENVRSTANLFGLPAFCQYGIGGPGFGAWRELAVHTMTTNWVLADQFGGFPLMYHWRVLPDAVQPLPEELADVEAAVAYWGGAPQVRHRIEALRGATASLALFLEYVPHNLHDWLGARVKDGAEATDQACAMVERELAAGVSFMNERGLLHFDAHFENILTDGRRLYFADYGLALSSRFQLTGSERGFFERHRTYDRCYTVTYLVIWLVAELYGYDRQQRDAFIRACAEGTRADQIPQAAADLLARHAPLASVMTDFNRRLRTESRQTPYPLEELLRRG